MLLAAQPCAAWHDLSMADLPCQKMPFALVMYPHPFSALSLQPSWHGTERDKQIVLRWNGHIAESARTPDAIVRLGCG